MFFLDFGRILYKISVLLHAYKMNYDDLTLNINILLKYITDFFSNAHFKIDLYENQRFQVFKKYIKWV